MWRLKIGKGEDSDSNPYLYSTNDYVGRQTWKFDPKYGTPAQRAEVDDLRRHFWDNRHHVKPSSDLLWRNQSKNGGLAAWEPAGASDWLELLNPTEFLADIVIEHEYVGYLEDIQRPNGSWYGNWGICFTYGTWFALGGLAAAGKTYKNCLTVQKAVDFLLNSQRGDGGWGESYVSCPRKEYVPLEENRSNLVQTAWAMMSLMHSGQEFNLILPKY